VAGSRSVDFLDVCSTDPNNDGDCTHDEADLWDVLIYDPVSKKAVTVLTATSPEFAPATFTGMLRRAPNRVAEAQVVQNEPIRLSDGLCCPDPTRPDPTLGAVAVADSLLPGEAVLIPCERARNIVSRADSQRGVVGASGCESAARTPHTSSRGSAATDLSLRDIRGSRSATSRRASGLQCSHPRFA